MVDVAVLQRGLPQYWRFPYILCLFPLLVTLPLSLSGAHRTATERITRAPAPASASAAPAAAGPAQDFGREITVVVRLLPTPVAVVRRNNDSPPVLDTDAISFQLPLPRCGPFDAIDEREKVERGYEHCSNGMQQLVGGHIDGQRQDSTHVVSQTPSVAR